MGDFAYMLCHFQFCRKNQRNTYLHQTFDCNSCRCTNENPSLISLFNILNLNKKADFWYADNIATKCNCITPVVLS